MRSLLFFSLLFILVGLFSLLSNKYPSLGIVSISLGVFGNILLIIRSYYKSKERDDLLNIQNRFLQEGKKGNVLFEYYRKKMDRKRDWKGRAKPDFNLLDRAVKSAPKDINALLELLTFRVLQLEQKFSITGTYNSNQIKRIKNQLNNKNLKKDKEHRYLVLLGMIEDMKFNHTKAQEYFRKYGVLTKNPYHHIYISTSLMKEQKFEDALKELIKIKHLNDWNYFFVFGQAYQGLNEYEKAEKYFKIAYRIRGNKLELVGYIAKNYVYNSKFLKANYWQYKYSLILLLLGYPRSFFLFIVANILLITNVLFSFSRFSWKLTKRIPFIRELHVKILSPIGDYISMGNDYFRSKDFKQARSYFEKCTDLIDTNADCYAKLAICYSALKEKQKGIEFIRRAIRLKPEDIFYNNVLKEIEEKDEIEIRFFDNYKAFERHNLYQWLSRRTNEKNN